MRRKNGKDCQVGKINVVSLVEVNKVESGGHEKEPGSCKRMKKV